MTPEEIRELARRIVDRLEERALVPEPPPDPRPARSEPPPSPRPAGVPVWAGAAQPLDDVAPTRRRGSGRRHRPSYDALTAAARQAAAGRGPSPHPRGSGDPLPRGAAGRSVPVAVSNRHIHLSAAHVAALFGAGAVLAPDRPIKQPGQYAAQQRLRVVGPAGAIDGVRVVGPARGHTQVELATSDAQRLGIDPPIRASGQVAGSHAIRLEGPAGSVDLPEGAIIPARHLHVAPDDAVRLGLADGDRVTVTVGVGDRRTSLHDVLVRSGPAHATELHLDVDEARAVGLRRDGEAVLGRARRGKLPARPTRRRVITERDVDAIAAAGRTVARGPDVVITPSAIDRAKALGVWSG